jgi:hypothetical protein
MAVDDRGQVVPDDDHVDARVRPGAASVRGERRPTAADREGEPRGSRMRDLFRREARAARTVRAAPIVESDGPDDEQPATTSTAKEHRQRTRPICRQDRVPVSACQP